MHRRTTRNRYAATLFLLLLPLATKKIQAQFDIEDSNTTASLRGIHNVGGGVAWASGTNGTVLRTEDGGYLWQTCTIPPGAEKLDFRGIQAFDENTAIVMSSGKGDLSRLYKTTDGCQTWKLLFTNPDKEGFWDAIVGVPDNKRPYSGEILGDPIGSAFQHLNLDKEYSLAIRSTVIFRSTSAMTKGTLGNYGQATEFLGYIKAPEQIKVNLSSQRAIVL